jgi:hypothetical protein
MREVVRKKMEIDPEGGKAHLRAEDEGVVRSGGVRV